MLTIRKQGEQTRMLKIPNTITWNINQRDKHVSDSNISNTKCVNNFYPIG